jgi:hypothetical protein
MLISFVFTMEDLLRGALLAQSDNALRDYIKTKNRLNRVFSFSLWAVLPLFLRYFFYFTNPDGFCAEF